MYLCPKRRGLHGSKPAPYSTLSRTKGSGASAGGLDTGALRRHSPVDRSIIASTRSASRSSTAASSMTCDPITDSIDTVSMVNGRTVRSGRA